ncbi:MAG: sodium-independent anion transporter [Rhodocyclaceae bacterium]|nr:sodium-independent anion transporter [Rhodocyclaceae bacterium]HNQ56597.1 SulP family inorganic anion transporter [Candidatus Desulfobacillus denitrificans]HNT62057.1 SulP family inorganic anion transporter [Candidatus Desulfobacillus denitrificans]
MPRTHASFRLPASARRFLPFLLWWPMVGRATLKHDLLAGLTGAIVVLPQGVAFATIAGMPPEYGLYAGMLPAVIAALFGSSWHLVSGPTTAASIVLFSVLSPHAEPGSAAFVQNALTLTFMVGAIQLGLGLARLGALINFISHSVVIGFTAGAAILIATSQVKHFFGIELPRGSSFADSWGAVIARAAEIDPYIFGVAGFTLGLGVLTQRLAKRLPYMIVAMLGGSLLSVALKAFGGPGAATISTVGALPGALPPLSSPQFTLGAFQDLATAALAVSLLALTEAVSIARALAVRSGQHIDGNQELVGQGLSNLFGSFFSSYVATGSFNRSGLNYAAGAKTPMASILASLLLVAIVLLVAPLAAYLPNAAMAGVLFLVAWGLIDFHHIRQILRAGHEETIIFGATFLATLLLNLEMAILLGVFLSLGFYLSRTSRPRVLSRVPDSRGERRKFVSDPALPECPQLKIVRIDGSLFFGAVSHVQEQLRALEAEQPGQKHLVIVASGINFIDLAGAEFLAQEARLRRAAGGDLWLIRVKPQVRETLENGGYLDYIGADHLFEGKSEAFAHIYARLDREVCRRCDKRIFRECGVAAVPERPAETQPPPLHAASLM